MKELLYLVLSKEECKHIDAVIPPKYIGYISQNQDPFWLNLQKDIYRHGKSWLYTIDGKTTREGGYHWEADLVYAYELLGKTLNPKKPISYDHVYIFKNLTEAEVAWISLSMDYYKIFTTQDGDRKDRMRSELMNIKLSMDSIKTAHFWLTKALRDTILNDKLWSQHLEETVEVLRKLRLNKKMLRLYEKKFYELYGLRYSDS